MLGFYFSHCDPLALFFPKYVFDLQNLKDAYSPFHQNLLKPSSLLLSGAKRIPMATVVAKHQAIMDQKHAAPKAQPLEKNHFMKPTEAVK